MGGGVTGDLTGNGTRQHYATPRQVAGGPLSSDVMKVLAEAARSVRLQRHVHLRAVGDPAGDLLVRDLRLLAAGVAQHGPKARWLTFANGPGRIPLGEPPVSQPYGLGEQLADLLDWVVQQNVGRGSSAPAKLPPPGAPRPARRFSPPTARSGWGQLLI